MIGFTARKRETITREKKDRGQIGGGMNKAGLSSEKVFSPPTTGRKRWRRKGGANHKESEALKVFGWDRSGGPNKQ